MTMTYGRPPQGSASTQPIPTAHRPYPAPTQHGEQRPLTRLLPVAPADAAWSRPIHHPWSAPPAPVMTPWPAPQYPAPQYPARPSRRSTTGAMVAIIAAALVLIGGTATALVVGLSRSDGAAPGPSPAPVTVAPATTVTTGTPATTAEGPLKYPPVPPGPSTGPATVGGPQTTEPVGPNVPEPTQPTEPTEPTEPTGSNGSPGQAEAEAVGAGFVDALHAENWADAAGYICRSDRDGFEEAAGESMAIKVDTLELDSVVVDGESGSLFVSYEPINDDDRRHEELELVVESGAWRICS